MYETMANITNNDEWKNALSYRLKEMFGKDTFTEEELTKEFYIDFRIKCGDFFTTEDGCFNMDLFWSENLKEWLTTPK